MDLQLKKQEEAKITIDNVNNNDCYIEPVNVMLKGLIGTKTEDLDVTNYDYSISISVKRNSEGLRKMTVTLKLLQQDFIDPGQMSLFESKEEPAISDLKSLSKNIESVSISSPNGDYLKINNRKANKKYSNLQV